MTDLNNAYPAHHGEHTGLGDNNTAGESTVSVNMTSYEDKAAAAESKDSIHHDSRPAEIHITIDDHQKSKEDEKHKEWIVQHKKPSPKLKDKSDYAEGTFAINEHERNDEKNPNREGTNLVPIYVRRIDSQEILPRPFKTTFQLIVCSYASLLCCIFCGACAAHFAVEAKMERNRGTFSKAAKSARTAKRLIVAAVISGLCVYALVLGLTFGVFLK